MAIHDIKIVWFSLLNNAKANSCIDHFKIKQIIKISLLMHAKYAELLFCDQLLLHIFL